MLTPADMLARPGDVAHVRTSSLYGWAIRRALPGAWGNHDAIVVYADGQWGIAEALCRQGFVVTPWSEYWANVVNGRTDVVFMRPPGFTEHAGAVVQMNALELAAAHVRYDWRAIAEIWARTVVGKAIPWQREWEWYCTEAVQACYRNAGEQWDVWRKQLPTPLTTEKRNREGALVRLGGLGDEAYRSVRA